MRRSERKPMEIGDNETATSESVVTVGTRTFFNTTHQPIAYFAADGVTLKYLDPKSRLTIPANEVTDELRTLLHNDVLMDETSATE